MLPTVLPLVLPEPELPDAAETPELGPFAVWSRWRPVIWYGYQWWEGLIPACHADHAQRTCSAGNSSSEGRAEGEAMLF